MAKIGRNQACPCGSGKKYKRCCWLEEQQGRAPGLQPSRADPTGFLHALGELDQTDMLLQAIERFQDLLRPPGPLAHLRWEAEHFRSAVDRHASRFLAAEGTDDPERALFGDAGSDLDGRAPWERLLDLAHPELSTQAFLDRAHRALTEVLERGGLEPLDQVIVQLVRTALSEERNAAYPSLLQLALFPVQLAELRSSFSMELKRLLGRFGDRPATLAEVEALLEDGAMDALTAAAERVPGLHAALSADADRILAEVGELLARPDPPPMVPFDIQVAVAAVVRRHDGDRGPGSAPAELLVELEKVVGGDAARTMRTLLGARLQDAASDTERERLRLLIQGATVDPLGVTLRALANPAAQPLLRDEGELALFGGDRDLRTYGDLLAPYEAWLRARSETAAADRVALAREVLGDLPLEARVLGAGAGTKRARGKKARAAQLELFR